MESQKSRHNGYITRYSIVTLSNKKDALVPFYFKNADQLAPLPIKHWHKPIKLPNKIEITNENLYYLILSYIHSFSELVHDGFIE